MYISFTVDNSNTAWVRTLWVPSSYCCYVDSACIIWYSFVLAFLRDRPVCFVLWYYIRITVLIRRSAHRFINFVSSTVSVLFIIWTPTCVSFYCYWYLWDCIYFIITHADDSRGTKTFIGVCQYLSVRTIEPKRLKLQSPNLPQG